MGGALDESHREDYGGDELLARLQTDSDDFLERLSRAEQRDSSHQGTRMQANAASHAQGGCGGAWLATPTSAQAHTASGELAKEHRHKARDCGMCGLCGMCALPRQMQLLQPPLLGYNSPSRLSAKSPERSGSSRGHRHSRSTHARRDEKPHHHHRHHGHSSASPGGKSPGRTAKPHRSNSRSRGLHVERQV